MRALKPEPDDPGAVEGPQGDVMAMSPGHDPAYGNERGRLQLPAVELPVEEAGAVGQDPQSVSLQDALYRFDEGPGRNVRNDVAVEVAGRLDAEATIDVL